MKFIIFILLSLSFGTSISESAGNGSQKRFKIFMVLWNGKTDLEKGFTSYLKDKNVNFEVEVRDCAGDRTKCHALIPEIRTYNPDLIYTWGTPACEEIAGTLNSSSKEYIHDVPMISLIVTDPINSKLINSLDKPGRNITGVNHVAPLEVQMNSMLLYKKNTKLVAAVYNPDETNSVLQVKALINTASQYGITIVDMPVLLDAQGKPDPLSIPKIVQQASDKGVDFLYTPPDTFMSVNCAAYVEAANKHKIPTFATTDSMYWKGKPMIGMLSRFINVGLFGGYKAYQILVEGKKPEEIAYDKLSRFSYIISLETAKKVGLEPPIPVFRFAEIIEDTVRIPS